MATQGEKIRGLRDFLSDAFTTSELKMFLTVSGYAEVAAAVNQSLGSVDYFFDVVQALQRRGLIDHEFFERLKQERSGKRAPIRVLQQLWGAEDQAVPKSPGRTTSNGPRKKTQGGPPASQPESSPNASRGVPGPLSAQPLEEAERERVAAEVRQALDRLVKRGRISQEIGERANAAVRQVLDPLFSQLLEGCRDQAKASEVLAFATAEDAYDALLWFIEKSHPLKGAKLVQKSQPGHLVAAKLVQHSCTFSKSILKALKERAVETTVYVQDHDTVKRILGAVGVELHWGAASNFELMYSKDLTWQWYKPTASLSAIWIKRYDDRCVLMLSWYVYRNLRCHFLDKQQRGFKVNENMQKKVRKATDRNQKIYGHNQPAFIIPDGAPGYDFFIRTSSTSVRTASAIPR
jgi:hypothetical protein